MEIKRLDKDFAVSGQVQLAEVSDLANLGYRSLICNRPDGEGADQPSFATIAAAAKSCGMEAHYLPAQPGQVGDAQGDALGTLMATLPKPILAYCRSGMRSATMWALAQAPHQGAAQLLAATQKAGYDLSAVAHQLAKRSRQS